ncbi:LytR/AlgR family response regulator transcription factor [Taibaiella koreensis]|uniref:LytR/AlgR family response regulator transcription factor n=1 Tax=Taibaiella koreensis TaxID=1268548 RepID=UPI000E599614|nr:response regulator transcription factor [Taibaiella koreensis]
MRILILEDEAIIAESLYQLLNLLEYSPYEPVDNPDDAIAMIRSFLPDLVLLDLNLRNGRSGLEVAAYLHEQKLNIPFIVLTAHGDAHTIATVKKYHPAAFLVKPFMRESLFAAIELATPDMEEEAAEDMDQDCELFLKTGTRYEKLDLRELAYVKANGKYTELHFTFGKRLIRMPLSTFIQENNNVQFLRVHKTYAVNPDFITSFTADELLLTNSRIPIGRFFMPGVNNYLRTRSFGRKK